MFVDQISLSIVSPACLSIPEIGSYVTLPLCGSNDNGNWMNLFPILFAYAGMYMS